MMIDIVFSIVMSIIILVIVGIMCCRTAYQSWFEDDDDFSEDEEDFTDDDEATVVAYPVSTNSSVVTIAVVL